tara:strand:+ start:1890 stop:2168 length:279 start_codon:yes stop_codon:yes gene_type:complete
MKSKDYEVTIWANGYRQWHAKAEFYPALGNTGEAERIAHNALRMMKRNLKRIIERNDGASSGYRFRWEVCDNSFTPGIGTLRSLTIREKEDI